MSSQGIVVTGKHGTATSSRDTSFDITVTGESHRLTGQVASSGAETAYDSTNDFPTSFDYLFFWADQDCHLQLIDVNATGTNVVFNILAKAPFVLSDGDLLATADETKITSSSTKTLRAINQIVIGAGGTDTNYTLILID